MQQTETEAEQKRDFKGVWIEKDLYLTKNLSWTEKILFTEIDSLNNEEGCYASNEHFADFLGAKESTISNAISKLKSLDLVKQESFDGRKRVLRTYPENIKKLRGRVLKTKRQGFKNHKESNTIYKYSKVKELSSEEDKGKPLVCDPSSQRPPLDISLKRVGKSVPEKAVSARRSRPTKANASLPEQRITKGMLPYENASPEAREVIDAWNKLETTPVHGTGSKAVQGVCRLLDDRLLKRHSLDEIVRTMRDFSDMQQDVQTYKAPARKVSIADFFSSNGYVASMRHRRGQPVEPPWFDRLILPGSFMKYRRKQDPHPEYTAEFKMRYEKHVLCEKPSCYTPVQEDKFAASSDMLSEYMKKGRLEKYIPDCGWKDYIHWFFRALADQYGATQILPGHLRSVNSWNNVFPRFLSRHWET